MLAIWWNSFHLDKFSSHTTLKKKCLFGHTVDQSYNLEGRLLWKSSQIEVYLQGAFMIPQPRKSVRRLVSFFHCVVLLGVGCGELVQLHTQINSNTYFNLLLHVHHIIFQRSVFELTVYTCYHNEHQPIDFLILICLLVGLFKVSPGHARANMAAVTATTYTALSST